MRIASVQLPSLLRKETFYAIKRFMMSGQNNVKSANLQVWPKVVLFGDSLTQFSFSHDGCWGSLLAEFLQRKCDVINRGFSGYNARWCVRMLPGILQEFQPKDIAMVTIFLGANDSNLPGNKQQHVPVSEYKDCLLRMVDKLQVYGIPREKIVLISPPACDEKAWQADCDAKGKEMFKSNTETAKYSTACHEAAKEAGTGFVDLYVEMMKTSDWELMLNDGLHLSPQGSTLLFNLLRPHADTVSSGLQEQFPDWKDVDNANPGALIP